MYIQLRIDMNICNSCHNIAHKCIQDLSSFVFGVLLSVIVGVMLFIYPGSSWFLHWTIAYNCCLYLLLFVRVCMTYSSDVCIYVYAFVPACMHVHDQHTLPGL